MKIFKNVLNLFHLYVLDNKKSKLFRIEYAPASRP